MLIKEKLLLSPFILISGFHPDGQDGAGQGQHHDLPQELRSRVPHWGDDQVSVCEADQGRSSSSITLGLNCQDKTALGEEAVFLAESIFRVFDNDCSGTMDFQEYVLALHSTRLVYFILTNITNCGLKMF